MRLRLPGAEALDGVAEEAHGAGATDGLEPVYGRSPA